MEALQTCRKLILSNSSELLDRLADELKPLLERSTQSRSNEPLEEAERAREQSAKLNALEEENSKLKEQLQTLLATGGLNCNTGKAIGTLEISKNHSQGTEGSGQYTLLERKYKISVKEHEELKKAFTKLRSRHEETKARLKEWTRYRQSEQTSVSKKLHSTKNISHEDDRHGSEAAEALDLDQQPGTGDENSLSKPVEGPLLHTLFDSSAKPHESDPRLKPHQPSRKLKALPEGPRRESSPELPPAFRTPVSSCSQPGRLRTREILETCSSRLSHRGPETSADAPRSSQTTGVVDIDEVSADPQDSSDTPSIVAVHSLKRKRHQSDSRDDFVIHDDSDQSRGSSVKLVSVKSELGSSSPLGHTTQHPATNVPATQDLDDSRDVTSTPRKETHFPDKFNAPQRPVLQQPSHIIDLEDKGLRASSEPADIRPSQRQQDQSFRPINRKSSMVLQPLDKNVHIFPRTSDINEEGKSKRRRMDGRGADAIFSVAEDGEDLTAKTSSTRKLVDGADAQCYEYVGAEGARTPGIPMSAHRRLGALLAEPTPSKAPLFSNTPVRANSAKAASKISAGTALKNTPNVTKGTHPQQGLALFKKQFPKSAHHPRVLEKTKNVLNTRNEISPDDEPLRARPVTRLGLDHFRINPNRNQGYDYAYTDVVRVKDQRKSLPNCTRPECCGSGFRKMAEIGGLPVAPKHDLFNSSPVDEEEGERRLLEDYLGYDQGSLRNLDANQRHDLLIAAKTKRLANQYGRHRHAHERPRSPPGFWRASMPDTQEMEKDREEARALERRKVKERHLEAMRRGVWMFADE